MSFELIDIIIICFYFAATFVIGFYYSKSKNNATEYFLAGRHIGWVVMGSALFATNISSEHVIGLTGTAYAHGMGSANIEYIGALTCVLLPWLFGSIYINSNVFTMPELIERRFNSFCRVFLSVMSILAYILTKISVILLAGGIFLGKVAGIDIYTSSIILVIATGIYTVAGGLTSVTYTAAVQGFLMIGGGIILTIVGLQEVGGLQALKASVPHEEFILLRPMTDPTFPWTGVLFGIPILTIWYHCTDQFMVQKFLSSKNLQHAQAGSIFSAYLKLFPILLYMVPGLIAKTLYPGISSDEAYPTMVMNLLAPGLKGIVIAAFLAALMSSLSSAFASCSALFTLDIYKKIYPDANDFVIVNVGRIMTFVIVILAIIWVIFIKSLSQELFLYFQTVTAYIAPPITAVFLMGILWSRANALSASVALVSGLVIGMFRFVIEVLVNKHYIMSGILYDMAKINFLHFGILLFLISVSVMVAVSLLSEKPQMEKLHGLTVRYASLGNGEIKQMYSSKRSFTINNIIASVLFVLIIISIYIFLG